MPPLLGPILERCIGDDCERVQSRTYLGENMTDQHIFFGFLENLSVWASNCNDLNGIRCAYEGKKLDRCIDSPVQTRYDIAGIRMKLGHLNS